MNPTPWLFPVDYVQLTVFFTSKTLLEELSTEFDILWNEIQGGTLLITAATVNRNLEIRLLELKCQKAIHRQCHLYKDGGSASSSLPSSGSHSVTALMSPPIAPFNIKSAKISLSKQLTTLETLLKDVDDLKDIDDSP
ncbi:hypothetical protein COOONC_15497 [Cooperia oncophora]